MVDSRRDRRVPAPAPVPSSAIPLFAIVVGAALASGAAGHFIAGNAGLVAAAVVALCGAVVAMLAARRPADDGESKARELTSAVDAGTLSKGSAPPGWRGAWGSLYERVAVLSQQKQAAGSAAAELERIRRQAGLAIAALREGKDPLAEVAELRVGPLRELLEAAKEGAAAAPVVSRLPMGEEELIGADGEALPEPWPAGADDPAPIDPRVRVEVRRGLDQLIGGLAALKGSVQRQSGGAGGSGGAAGRSAAQLVDAVVHTAADGIEDLAAGLMRANELAGVAERVTNKATLLALNAALEATRSGSEAFAAIAEETRRLAEFAREATDTISRLSNEIEYKVGETITAIHATSEDAKTAVAALGLNPGSAAPAPVVTVAEVDALLARARSARDALGGTAPNPDSRDPAEPPRSDADAQDGGEGSDSPRRPTQNIMLLEGLSPGSSLDG